MKAKLTVSIDEDLIPRVKRFARGKGISLSEFVESSLRSVTDKDEASSFSERWRGKLQPADRPDERYRHLAKRYL